LSSDSVAAPYAVTISSPLLDIPGCNIGGVPAADEIAARILSADTAASAAGVLNAVADPLDFPGDL